MEDIRFTFTVDGHGNDARAAIVDAVEALLGGLQRWQYRMENTASEETPDPQYMTGAHVLEPCAKCEQLHRAVDPCSYCAAKESDEEALARMEREFERIQLGMPKQLIHRHDNTYFQKMGHLHTVDLIEDEHGRWIAAVFQGELGVDNQQATAARIAELWNAREANTPNPPHLPLADVDARAEWSIDAQMAERAHNGHWWGGNPHAVEAPGHFPEDEEPAPVDAREASTIQLELEDEAGNIDLCECEPAPSTRVIRVIRRVKHVAQYEPGDSIIYRAQYSYACGYHD